MAAEISGTFTIADGSLDQNVLSSGTQIPISKIAQKSAAITRIKLTDLRKTDGTYDDVLPDSTTTGDSFLSLVGGTHGTATPMVKTADFKTTSGTQSCRFQADIPANYDDEEDISIRIRARLQNDADTSKTIDVLAFLEDGDGAVSGSDKCTTAAQTLTTSWANYTFAITSTGVSAGDSFDIQIDVALNDAASGSAVICEISKIELLTDNRG